MKCGSPGFVAPEILNGQSYNTKADIFSAGIILCMILTGVSPFHDKCHDNILIKNKEAKIDFAQPHWAFISTEAKHLVSRMTARDPQRRYTAAQALEHPWFSLEQTETLMLSSAQENMGRYCREKRFDVGRIKPEFSTVTCTPLFNSRFACKDSPLLIPISNIPNKKVVPLLHNGKMVQVQRHHLVEDADDFCSDDSSMDDSANFDESKICLLYTSDAADE
eukprot:TRINITY_DN9548_c0_g1_i2.p1 TRINITY_DN9548_c0_g1~~TRINITY_DN9548_c0_g1_i2.p1  ORF type:complete len:221 (+),score=57.91 TRINITY_DN9548_c0_g1_i2:1120-1782(+)